MSEQIVVAAPPEPRRVTVVAPHTRADVALPPGITVAEATAQLVRLLDMEAEDPAGSSWGWLLTRLGREPFDDEQPVAGSGIRDGDLLFLSARSSRLPPVVFDDVVDAVAVAAGGRSGRWAASTTRVAALLGAGAVAALGLWPAVSAPAPSGLLTAAVAGLAVLLLLAATALARSLGEPRLAAATGAAAAAYAGVAGLLSAGEPVLAGPGAAALLVAAAAVLSVAVLTMVVVGAVVPALLAVLVTAGAAVVALGWTALTGHGAARVAAVTAAVLLAAEPLLPAPALRLARLPFPHLPASAVEFRSTDPVALDDAVLATTRRADLMLAALAGGLHVVLAAAVAVLVTGPGRAAPLLGIAVALAALLRARHADGTLRRAVTLAAPLLGLLPGALRVAGTAEVPGRALLAAAAVGLAAACVAYARKAPGRSPSPYWGRLLDVAEFAAIVAVLPLVAGVLGLYARVRGLTG